MIGTATDIGALAATPLAAAVGGLLILVLSDEMPPGTAARITEAIGGSR